MSSNQDNHDEGWGWEALGSEDENNEGNPEYPNENIAVVPIQKTLSEKSLSNKRNNIGMQCITSSPSFQELEKAIGATLALSFSSNDGDPQDVKTGSPSSSMINARLSSTNLTQQKVMQQRIRQQYQKNTLGGFKGSYNSLNNIVNARNELSPFINESESRALILFHSPSISQNLIKDSCSKYGVLYYIRPEFHNKGVTFLSYFDLQAATSAKENLSQSLGPQAESSVHYSVMLHATNSNTEEYKLVVKNLPTTNGSENDIQMIFARYGALRSIQKTFGSGSDLNSQIQNSLVAYTIEYFNIQDARLAASELSATSSTIWGPEVLVKFAPLDDRKQQLCKQLLATLSRWRSEISINPNSSNSPMQTPLAIPSLSPTLHLNSFQQMLPGMPIPILGTQPLGFGQIPGPQFPLPPMIDLNGNFQGSGMLPSPMPMNGLFNQTNYGSPRHSLNIRPNYFIPHPYSGNDMNLPLYQTDSQYIIQQNINLGPPQYINNERKSDNSKENERSSVSQNFSYSNNQKNESRQMYQQPHANSYYNNESEMGTNHINNSNSNQNRYSAKKKPNYSGVSNKEQTSDSDFNLDISNILDGREHRTTVMVRNIPNKYTQHMLLDEVNLKHNGTYDFFYLPIDFKNKCNVGYCFINFLDVKYIPPFVNDFHGQRWKSFNSEKICAVSFARIQGKNALIARFQNSSLLEKDDEYQPLLFHSNGPEMGKPEPFPHLHRLKNNELLPNENESN